MKIPTQKEVFHINFDMFLKSLSACLSVVDFTSTLEIAGGEPFLHEDLPSMIREYMKYSNQFESFLIVTNGTIIPDSNLVEVLERYRQRGIVRISDYNIYPDKTRQLIQILDEIGFSYRVDKYFGEDQYMGGWIDTGEVSTFNRSMEELKSIYSNCGLVKNGGCWRMHRGQIHLCARSTLCFDAGIDNESDYVDLFDNSTTIIQKKEMLHSLILAPYLNACDYCTGNLGTSDVTKRIGAAEQI